MKIKTMVLKSEANANKTTIMNDHGRTYKFSTQQIAERVVRDLGYNLVYQESAITTGCVAIYTRYVR